MAIKLPLTANELRAAMILVTECLSGMGGSRPADLGGDEYTWIDAKMLMAHGYSAASANATIGALKDKGFICDYDKGELVLDTPAWQHLDTVWDEYQAAQTKEVHMTKAVSKKQNKSARKPAAKAQPNPDVIKTNINDSTGAHIVVTSVGGATISYPRYADDKQRRALSAVGGSLAALQADLKARPPVKPQAQMARGTDAHTAPHSAKAVADQRAAAKGSKAAKTSAPKAAKAKQPSRGTDRDYTRGKAEISAKPDSWRGYMLACITKHTNTAKAKAAHEKSGKFSGNKLDFNWAAAQGYIVWAK